MHPTKTRRFNISPEFYQFVPYRITELTPRPSIFVVNKIKKVSYIM